VTSTERVEAVSHGPHGVVAKVRGHTLTTDRPPEMGGADHGLMASEHLLVALASCTATSATKIAAKRGVPLADLRVVTEMDFDDRGEVSGLRLAVRVRSEAPEADVRKVFDLAERVCTISKLLSRPVERTLTVEPRQ
jgi:putative redox protein